VVENSWVEMCDVVTVLTFFKELWYSGCIPKISVQPHVHHKGEVGLLVYEILSSQYSTEEENGKRKKSWASEIYIGMKTEG
jgi:hypothetical protein